MGKNIQFSKDELTTMINKGINPNPLSTPDFTKNGSILCLIKTLEENAKFLQQG